MPPPPPLLFGARVRVSLADDADAGDLLEFHRRNLDRLKRWMPPVPETFLTPDYWARWVTAAQWLYDKEQAMRLIVRHGTAADAPLIAQANFSNIVKGPFQACLLGYHVDGGAEGRGLMREALQLGIRFVFEEIRLHRIMANYIPGNDRSARLLERLGFEREGYARDYLFIDGAWRDHVLTALTNPAQTAPVADRDLHTGRAPLAMARIARRIARPRQ